MSLAGQDSYLDLLEAAADLVLSARPRMLCGSLVYG